MEKREKAIKTVGIIGIISAALSIIGCLIVVYAGLIIIEEALEAFQISNEEAEIAKNTIYTAFAIDFLLGVAEIIVYSILLKKKTKGLIIAGIVFSGLGVAAGLVNMAESGTGWLTLALNAIVLAFAIVALTSKEDAPTIEPEVTEEDIIDVLK